jgi:hypothetical protein
MKSHPLTKTYAFLAPEERWRLIMAASSRDDQVEKDKLLQAGGRITLSMRDHAPFAHAFDELSNLMFIVLLEDAALYQDAFDRCHEEEFEESEDAERLEDQQLTKIDKDSGEHSERNESLWDRFFDLLLASGYMLKTNVQGWKLFCEKLNIPPLVYWEMLPGYDRLQDALTLAEKAAFTPEGFIKWLNRIRPTEEPELTNVPMTANGVATAIEMAFRQRAQWWGGE